MVTLLDWKWRSRPTSSKYIIAAVAGVGGTGDIGTAEEPSVVTATTQRPTITSPIPTTTGMARRSASHLAVADTSMVAGVIMAVGISTGVAAENMAADKDMAGLGSVYQRAGRRSLYGYLVVESARARRSGDG